MHFSEALINWYFMHKRDLPWRQTNSAYHIWLSEIMLQQTQVIKVLDYYNVFLNKYPSIHDLAQADEDEVLKLWQGLGYYSRARNLHASAKVISDNKGVFPQNYEALKKLKGVGDYTAAAIASFAFGEAKAVVDGNVYRVLSRFLGIDLPINSTEGVKLFKEKAEELLDRSRPADHNQAIMEFGALLCRPKNPDCAQCPLQIDCVAFQQNKVSQLPVKLKKVKVTKRYLNYLILEDASERFLIQKRTQKDIWQHMFEFPLSETQSSTNEITTDAFGLSLPLQKLKRLTDKPIKHQLTHQSLYTDFWKLSLTQDFETYPQLAKNYTIVTQKELLNYAVPVLIANFIQTHFFKG